MCPKVQPPWFVKSPGEKPLLLSKDFIFHFKLNVGPVFSLCLLKGQAHVRVSATTCAKLVGEKNSGRVLPD